MERSSSAEEIAIAKTAGGLERRRQQRFDCEGPAEVVALDSGELYRREVRDLSLSGCYILSGVRLDLDRRADVELHLRVQEGTLSTPARVIVVRPESGAAFEFLPVDPEMRNALLAVIRRLAAGLASQEARETTGDPPH